MANGPRFLDGAEQAGSEAASPVPPGIPDAASVPPLPRGPILLEPEPGAPEPLRIGWEPGLVALARSGYGTAIWIGIGVGVLLGSWICLSFASFVIGLFRLSSGLGILEAAAIAVGLGLVGYGSALEWRAYRSLEVTDRLRRVLVGNDLALESVRAAALAWSRKVAGHAVIKPGPIEQGLLAAATVMEIRAVLRSRLLDKLRDASLEIGTRAAVEGAILVAICPHPALDGLIVSARSLVMVRQIARLYGVRPGLAVTLALLRRIAVSAAGTSAFAVLSQGFANELFSTMPVAKHLMAAVPGASAAGVRLHRLAGITADACCPARTSSHYRVG